VTDREQKPQPSEVADRDGLATALLESSPDGLLLVDPAGIIVLANPSAATIFGADQATLVGAPVDSLVPREQRERHARYRDSYTVEPMRRPMGTGLRLFAQHADGTLFPVEISLSPVALADATTGDDVIHTIATVRDISAREETHARVALMQDRERIARDLHDMVIQRLFATGMSLQAVTGAVEVPIVAERIATTIDDLDDTIGEIRRAIFHLGEQPERRPLDEQVELLVVERAPLLGLDPELEIIGDLDDVPDFVGTQLLATLREGLSNVNRHADASSCRVRLVAESGVLTLSVSDDGRGIPPGPKRQGGLANMMWRAAELGGTCAVTANEPSGTLLTWRVPV